MAYQWNFKISPIENERRLVAWAGRPRIDVASRHNAWIDAEVEKAKREITCPHRLAGMIKGLNAGRIRSQHN